MARKPARKSKAPSLPKGPSAHAKAPKKKKIDYAARAQKAAATRKRNARTAAKLHQKYSARSRKGWQTRKQKAAASTTGRQQTKTGRPRNRTLRGTPTKYIPRTTTGETVEQLERFDFRGLSSLEQYVLWQKCLARVDELVREHDFVAMRLLYSMTPIAAAKRTVSPKAAKSAKFREDDPLASARPITQWTGFHVLGDRTDAQALADEIFVPAGREEVPDINAGVLILAAELTWR